jgi:hypothetical protein
LPSIQGEGAGKARILSALVFNVGQFGAHVKESWDDEFKTVGSFIWEVKSTPTKIGNYGAAVADVPICTGRVLCKVLTSDKY